MSQGHRNETFVLDTGRATEDFQEPPPSYDDVTKSLPRRDVVEYSRNAGLSFVSVPLQESRPLSQDVTSQVQLPNVGRTPKSEV